MSMTSSPILTTPSARSENCEQALDIIVGRVKVWSYPDGVAANADRHVLSTELFCQTVGEAIWVTNADEVR